MKAIFDREDVSFRAFKGKEAVRAIPAPGAAAQPRSWFDKMNEWARGEGAAGLGYIVFEEEGGVLAGKGPIAKFLSAEALQQLAVTAAAKSGDAVFFAADKEQRAATLAGQARLKIGNELGLTRKDCFEFCWIVDFPMYEWNEDEKKIDFSHNPFSMPNFDHAKFLALDPADRDTILGINAFQYDIVCNGVELSSGAIRNHKPEIMLKAFEIAGYAREETESALRRHAERVPLWRAAAWRHRARHRPHRDAARRRAEHPRSDHVPDESAGRGFADGRALGGFAQAIARAPHPRGAAGETVAGLGWKKVGLI